MIAIVAHPDWLVVLWQGLAIATTVIAEDTAAATAVVAAFEEGEALLAPFAVHDQAVGYPLACQSGFAGSRLGWVKVGWDTQCRRRSL